MPVATGHQRWQQIRFTQAPDYWISMLHPVSGRLVLVSSVFRTQWPAISPTDSASSVNNHLRSQGITQFTPLSHSPTVVPPPLFFSVPNLLGVYASERPWSPWPIGGKIFAAA